jgi:SAM-dependent methyltransferase
VKNTLPWPTQLPKWMSADFTAIDDLDQLQIANRYHQPPSPHYLRAGFGFEKSGLPQDDHRLKYLLYYLDLRDLTIMELGPQQGIHSVLLDKLGHRKSVAIEGRLENYQACLAAQRRYRLDRTEFVHANLEDLYSDRRSLPEAGAFDLVFCLGVLYHLPDPAAALRWFRRQAPRLFLGTLYWQPDEAARYPNGEPHDYSDGEVSHAALRVPEGGLVDPYSGLSPSSVWLTEESLCSILRRSGYQRVHVLGHDLQNGCPHLTILAE